MGIAILGGRPFEGVIHLERALGLNPNSLEVVKSAGFVFGMVGAHTKALELYMRAMQISPLDSGAFETYFGISMQHFSAQRFQEAKSWADRALSEKPDFMPALIAKAASMAAAGFPQKKFMMSFRTSLRSDLTYQSRDRASGFGVSGRRTSNFS
jgi:tetratricopeptide (TPR) repeat protein